MIQTVSITTVPSPRADILSTLDFQVSKVYRSTDNRKLTHRQRSRMSATLARQLMKADKELSLGDAMRQAWAEIKADERQFKFVEYRKVSGKVVRKVIMAGHISEYFTPKGTGRPLKPNQRLYVDAGCHLLGKYAIRSYYTDSIITKF